MVPDLPNSGTDPGRASKRVRDVRCHVFKVDFDQETELLEANRIPRQSTILIWQGEKEIARSIAETDRDRLRAFVFEAVAEASE